MKEFLVLNKCLVLILYKFCFFWVDWGNICDGFYRDELIMVLGVFIFTSFFNFLNRF